MRVSAPSLAVSEKPYYEYESTSGDALISAVGRGIEEGLTHDLLSNRTTGSTSAANFPISNLLVLPNSFGTLFLGETFRTYLCVRNEAATAVREPSLRVEMQVGADQDNGRWHQLAHVILPTPTRYSPDPAAAAGEEGRPVWELSSGEPLETSLEYDIKDLGPHVLVCTVGYKSPLQQGSEVVWVERSFRKYYKFTVDRSPISVRTKVHHPRHASSLTHPDDAVRRRVELEVQVQNVAGNGASLVFSGLKLKPAPGWGWDSIDRPSLKGEGGEEDMWLRKGGNELLADGDIRQYLFTLTPEKATTVAGEATKSGIDLGRSAEGYAIRGDALGHLDISWRMSLGEPGRLQTSQLVRRRVVTPPVTAPASSSSKLAPQLSTQLTLQDNALKRLREVTPGSLVQVDVQVSVCDLSSLALPESAEEDRDDDDTPLSEIASSPRNRRAALQATDRINIRRTLRLALQQCSIDPPTSSPSTAVAPPGSEPTAESPSTPRKTPMPSRTSTPTQSSMSALNKSRLQANLTNLVRNSSLTLRPARGSVDSPRSDSEGSRSGTPLPPVPPKHDLAAAAEVHEKKPAERGERMERKSPPSPSIPWHQVVELYKVYTETHAQALTRTAHPTIPPTFLPSPYTQPFASTLTPLPPLHLQLSTLTTPTGTPHRPPPTDQDVQTTITASLYWTVDDDTPPYEAVRFGAVRLILLSYTDQQLVDGKQEQVEEVECMTILQHWSVLAEAVVMPH